MKYLRITTIAMLALVLAFGSQAQDKFGVRVKINQRQDSGIGYNFFLGDDTDYFQTTIKGFGSGFLFDIFSGRTGVDFLQIGTDAVFISLGAGLAGLKYRLKDNLAISVTPDGSKVQYAVDNNPAHDYVNTFFGYGKSKIVISSFFVPAHLNFVIARKVTLSAGGFIDFFLFGKHKRKYIEDGEKVKALTKPKEFRDFNLNKIKYGLSASIIHNKSGIGLTGAYYLTPFFQEGKGPELNQARVSIVLPLMGMTDLN